VPVDGMVLDVGCGTGEPIARYLMDTGRRVFGVDSSPSMIGICHARFRMRVGSWQTCASSSLADVSPRTLGQLRL